MIDLHLVSRKLTQRYNIRDGIVDPIVFNDNGWLVRQVDDDNDNEDEGNELVPNMPVINLLRLKSFVTLGETLEHFHRSYCMCSKLL